MKTSDYFCSDFYDNKHDINSSLSISYVHVWHGHGDLYHFLQMLLLKIGCSTTGLGISPSSLGSPGFQDQYLDPNQ